MKFAPKSKPGIYQGRQSFSERLRAKGQRRWRRLRRRMRRLGDQGAMLSRRLRRLMRRLADQGAMLWRRLMRRLADQGPRRRLRGGPYGAAAIGVAAVLGFVFMWPYGHWLDREPATRFMTLNGHHALAMYLAVAAVVILAYLVLPTHGFISATPRQTSAFWLAGFLTLVSAGGFLLAAMAAAFLVWRLTG